MTRSAG